MGQGEKQRRPVGAVTFIRMMAVSMMVAAVWVVRRGWGSVREAEPEELLMDPMWAVVGEGEERGGRGGRDRDRAQLWGLGTVTVWWASSHHLGERSATEACWIVPAFQV